MKTVSMALALGFLPVLTACGNSSQEEKQSGDKGKAAANVEGNATAGDEGAIEDGGETRTDPSGKKEDTTTANGSKEPNTAPQVPKVRELEANDPVGTEAGLDLSKAGRQAAINGHEILIVDANEDVDDSLGLVALDGSRIAKLQQARAIIQELRTAKSDGSLTADKLLEGCKAVIQLNLCDSFPRLPVCQDSTTLSREMTIADKFKLTVTRKDGIASCSVSPLGTALLQGVVTGPYGYNYTYWPTAHGVLVRGPAGNFGFIRK